MIKQKSQKTNLTAENSQQLKTRIAELENSSAELKDKLARSLADYANLEKRIESQRQILYTLAVSSVLSKMIDVLDDLYLAQTHLNDKGLEIAISKFISVLKSEGLEEINAVGQVFNPESMDCIDVAEGKKDTVISIKKRGYTLNGQNIRPAQVVVGRDSENNQQLTN